MADRLSGEAALGEASGHLATPLHIQRLENALRLDLLLDEAQKVFTAPPPLSDFEDTTETDAEDQTDKRHGKKTLNGNYSTLQERQADKMQLYNFSKVKKSRRWLRNLLLSDTSDSDCDDRDPSEEDLVDLLKFHKLKKSAQADYLVTPELRQYQYYSSGILSNADKFHEHQKLFLGSKKKSKEKNEKKKVKLKKIKAEKLTDEDLLLQGWARKQQQHDDASIEVDAAHHDGLNGSISLPQSMPRGTDSPPEPTVIPKASHSKRKNASAHEAAMTAKRRRIFVALSKKEVVRAQKQKAAAHKEVLQNAKRLAQACQRECRKMGLVSQKAMKETCGRARRLTKEMLLYWKRYDKVEKEHRRKAEKEAQEQLRMDIELREAKRQQRKLNFLITQTELYAHFVSRKMATRAEMDERQAHIISQLDERKHDATIAAAASSSSSSTLLDADDDDYNCEEAKALALRNAEEAYNAHQLRTRAFDQEVELSLKTKRKVQDEFMERDFSLTNPSVSTEEDLPQPKMFVGKLKSYQVRGMNWLYNLYDKGINGILADEMGLGKTVQTIAFLATLSEVQGIWGPFLVIAPASTLHNWQQEFTKFIPKFRVLPYWGNLNERKILRKFWSQKGMHTEAASFHVLITSYQLVVTDVKYFQRIKWQYMVLDEAQAIKSTSSARWKVLLGFNCRNRLLLTGTPIQNSMAELWALLHFIMPTLFDSHEEFNEWFSKNIESHAENKSTIDEKHLSRLHMILKPFMLRRIKKDVENELSDKIEILVYCQLTQRQKMLYQGLKNKISIDDLMQSSSSTSSQAQSATSSLMNLVMQFRKVCNHPDLFDRREVKSPFVLRMDTVCLPRILFYDGVLRLYDMFRKRILIHLLGIFHPHHIHTSLNSSLDCCFSFTRFIDLSPSEVNSIAVLGLVARWLSCYLTRKAAYRVYHEHTWREDDEGSIAQSRFLGRRGLLVSPLHPTSCVSLDFSSGALKGVVFTSCTEPLYGFVDHVVHAMPETAEHREMRARKAKGEALTTHEHRQRPPRTFTNIITNIPAFLCHAIPKVVSSYPDAYCSNPSALRWIKRFQLAGSPDAYHLLLHGTTAPTLPTARKGVSPWWSSAQFFYPPPRPGLMALQPPCGWLPVLIPDKETLVTDSGKLQVLDTLLGKLKAESHRVLIYSQMTRMIDLLEIYMWHRKHTYMRLDGSSKISDRRDMVADFQTRSDIFVFLLSTRAGGLGINLTAADTVIFYDSDWNPTVDQQAMDRAHRLGQTKQVTVYRLICKGTIEERILQRAKEKSEIQRVVISGGNFKPDTLKPTEVVSLLLDDDELERKFRQRQMERKNAENNNGGECSGTEGKRKRDANNKIRGAKGRKKKVTAGGYGTPTLAITQTASCSTPGVDAESVLSLDSVPASPCSESVSSIAVAQDESSSEGPLVVDDGGSITPATGATSPSASPCGSLQQQGNSSTPAGKNGAALSSAAKRGSGRSRGRPRGSGRRRGTGTRGAMLAAAAAELAAAQAGKSAAYAAYGYTLGHGGATSPSTVCPRGGKMSPGSPIRSSSALLQMQRGNQRGRGLSARSPMCITQAVVMGAATSGGQVIGSSAAAIAAVTQNPQVMGSTPHAPGLGFYVQGSPS